MENIKQLICLIGFVLVMTTCMTETVIHQGGMGHSSKHSAKKLQATDCLNTTIRNHACHAERCHDSTTYIHGCDIYTDDLCDNLTVHYDVYNSTSSRNTTCNLYACVEDVADNCGNANLTFNSCTNGDCRSGVTRIHACYSSVHAMNHLGDASVLSGLDFADGVNDYFDIPCINLLFYTFRRTRFGSGK